MNGGSAAPDLLWMNGGFHRGMAVRWDRSGTITECVPARASDERLAGSALLPGFVNAHSHAFQIGLRGSAEVYPDVSGSFWSWREAMYDLVARMDRRSFREHTVRAYREMLAAGITTVGEFHYFHHATGEPDFQLDQEIVAAAKQTGINLVLLLAYYSTGGIDKPLDARQRRFATEDSVEFVERLDRTAEACRPLGFSVGAVVHSIRAASLDDLRFISQASNERRIPLHMHLEEQPREIEVCQTRYGLGPVALVQRELEMNNRFTAVHCTHTTPDDLTSLLQADANVCICPLTEANLGDGIPDLRPADGMRNIALGTDSNARISMIEEMRMLEFGQRTRRVQRGLLKDSTGAVAPELLRIATAGGARSLGLNAGVIEPGARADFCEVSLTAPPIEGFEEDYLSALVFGGGNDCVKSTWVGGTRVFGLDSR